MSWLHYQISKNFKEMLVQNQDLDSTESEIKLLNWVESSNLFENPILREVNFLGNQFYRATVSIRRENLSSDLPTGCGRSKSAPTALSKAYIETIERIVATEVQNEVGFYSELKINIQSDRFSILDSTKKIIMPPKKLRTTNGWAVHFDLNSAIENAYSEALERHLLQYTYFRDGWCGFIKSEPINWENLNMWSLASKYIQCGRRAGLVATKLIEKPGYTFGYFQDEYLKFPNSKGWLHAMMEGFEPAKFYDSVSEGQIKKLLDATTNPMDRVQLSYILNPNNLLGYCSPHLSIADVVDIGMNNLSANLVLVDIGKKWNLGFNLFGAFVYGESLIPLLFKPEFDVESQEYVQKILELYDIKAVPDVHPIL